MAYQDFAGKRRSSSAAYSRKTKGKFIVDDDLTGSGNFPIEDIFANTAPEFSASKDYKLNEYVIYSGILYRFKTNHSAGAFNASECWKVPALDKYIPQKIFATSSGTYSYDVSEFVLNSYNNRLETPTGTAATLFAAKGDKITIKPAAGLTVLLSSVTSFYPIGFTPLKTVSSGTDSYTFTNDNYILITITKTDSSTIALSDFGNTEITVKQSIEQQIENTNVANYSDYQDATNARSYTKLPVIVKPTPYGITEQKKMINLLDLATQDGKFTLGKNDLYQSGSHVNSMPIPVHKGDIISYDGTSDSTTASLTKKVGESYTTVVNTATSWSFTADSDFEVLYQIKNITLADAVAGNCYIERYVSKKTLERMQTEIGNAAGFSVPFPYAKIKDGRLTVCDPIVQVSRADYLAVEMPQNITKIGCKWYWGNSYGTKGSIAMAIMPNTWSKKVSGANGVTGKCLHITCTKTALQVDFLGQDWGEYYYTNLLTQAINLSTDPTVEHSFSAEISGENVIIRLDGSTYTGTNTSDKSMADVIGKYGFIEHYNPFSSECDYPEYSAFRVSDGNFVSYDTFARENGMAYCSPQGYPYINIGSATQTFPNW